MSRYGGVREVNGLQIKAQLKEKGNNIPLKSGNKRAKS